MRNYLRNYLTPNEQRVLYIILIVSFVSIIAFNITNNHLYSDEVKQDSILTDIKNPYEISVNIIHASKEELMQIPGIGSKKADNIIAFRDTFMITSNSQLTLIRGIGEKSLAKWLPYLENLSQDSLAVSKAEILKDRGGDVGRIDINTATLENLTMVKGVGQKKAKAIRNFIESNNGISDLNELLTIKGIGKKTLAKIEELFYVGSK